MGQNHGSDGYIATEHQKLCAKKVLKKPINFMCAMSANNASEQHNSYVSKESVGTTQKLCAKKKH